MSFGSLLVPPPRGSGYDSSGINPSERPYVNDGLGDIAKGAFGGFLSNVGAALNPTAKPADVKQAEAAQKWDWRMIGIIGAVVVGLVLLIRFRK